MSHHIARLSVTGVNEAGGLDVAAAQLASFLGVDQPTALGVIEDFGETTAKPVTWTSDGAVTSWQVDAEVNLDDWRASV